MGLIGNHSRLNFGAGRFFGIAPALTPGNRSKGGEWYNWIRKSGNTTVLKTSARPTGYYPGGAYANPLVAGEMSFDPTGAGTPTFNLVPAKQLLANMTGSSVFTALAGLIKPMLLAMTGGNTFSAHIVGSGRMVVTFTGSSTFAATIAAKGNMLAGLTGHGLLAATIMAFGDMQVHIVVTGAGLNTANVADAVWKAIDESGFTYRDVLNIIAAAAAGKASGGPGSPVFRDLGDTTNVITGTADSSGNRTAATYNPPS